MMEDWTDIIGEQLEGIEEPLPADDWSALQQKYAASRKIKRAALFAWAGGITSVAAAIALMLILIRSDTTQMQEGIIADKIPPVEELTPPDTTSSEVQQVAPESRKKPSAPVHIYVNKKVEDVLTADGDTESKHQDDSTQQNDTFHVINDTTSVTGKLLADASDPGKDDMKDDDKPTATFGFEDFPEDEPRRKRKPISVSMSGSVSGTPIIGMVQDAGPSLDPPDENLGNPGDSSFIETPEPPAMSKMRNKSAYRDSYKHEIPVSFGVSARFHLADRISVNTGLNYTRYKSTRSRYYYNSHKSENERQLAHYLGVPVRFDWMIVDRKHFNFYLGAGAQVDKCIYANVGSERLHEKQFLFSVNGAMGIQVNIVPTVGLYFEPDVSYSLNEGTLETFRSRESLMITARAGLRFNF